MNAYRRDIDGLRGVAVTLVVLFHAGIPGFSGGFVGVDVFFVLSGYLITSFMLADLSADRFSIAEFYRRRILRILPALTVTWLLTLCLGALLLLPFEFKAVALRLAASALFMSNIVLYKESGYFDASTHEKPLLHTWSLSIEEQFYIVWPLVAVIAYKKLGRDGVLAVLFLGTLTSLAYAQSVAGYDQAGAFYLLPSRFWELGTGAIAAMLIHRLQPSSPRLGAWLAGIGLGGIVTSVAMLDATTPFPGLSALPACVGTALLILSGAPSSSRVVRVLSSRPLVAIGLISYALYLVHWPVFSFLYIHLGRAPSPDLAVPAILGSVLIAWAIYRWVETPFRRAGRTRWTRPFPVILAGLATTSVVLGLCVHAIKTDGWHFRASERVAAFEREIGEKINDQDLCAYPEQVARKGHCPIGGASGAPDFLIYGDSHAQHIAPAILEHTDRAGLKGRIIAEQACPPLFRDEPRYLLPSGRIRHRCQEGQRAYLETLSEHGDNLRFVVIAVRWSLYARDIHPPEEGEGLHLPSRPEMTSLDVLREEVRQLISATTERGIPVALVSQVPPIGGNNLRCAKGAVWRGHPADKCRVPASVMADYLAPSRQLLRDLSKHPNVRLYDPFLRICPGATCLLRMDGTFMYYDDDHLNLSGSRKLADMFDTLPLGATR